MKRCPTCNRTFEDASLGFCLDDGTPLVEAAAGGASQGFGSGGGIKPPSYGAPQSYAGSEPAPTIAYTPSPQQPTPSWSQPAQSAPPKRKVWPWVLGGVVLISVVGIGLLILIIAAASLSSNTNTANANTNANKNGNLSGNDNSNRTGNMNMNSGGNANTNSNVNSNTGTKLNTSDISVQNLYLARDDGAGNAGERVEGFTTSDRVLHCVAELNKARPGTKVTFSWYAVSVGSTRNQLISSVDYATGPYEKLIYGKLTPRTTWPTGDYRVEVAINGARDESLDFSIE
ncbi:MAG TPA: hypothetical protein VF507_10675 [Pyrinomonadaceae bacterium]|jgi:hypothetical protein